MKWNDLTGEERYRVVELARKGTKSISEICETFGVTRQTLTKAIATTEEAAKAALEPKKPGRKGKSEEALKIIELSRKQSSLEKDVDHWKTRYEVAKEYIDLVHEQEEKTARNQRKRERQKQKEKKPRRSSTKSSRTHSGAAGGAKLAVIDGGANSGDTDAEPEAMEEEA